MSPSTGIIDGNHALLVGQIVGALWRAENDMRALGRVEILPVMIDGDYTNQITIEKASGKYLLTIEKLEDGEDL